MPTQDAINIQKGKLFLRQRKRKGNTSSIRFCIQQHLPEKNQTETKLALFSLTNRRSVVDKQRYKMDSRKSIEMYTTFRTNVLLLPPHRYSNKFKKRESFHGTDEMEKDQSYKAGRVASIVAQVGTGVPVGDSSEQRLGVRLGKRAAGEQRLQQGVVPLPPRERRHCC